jgi:L-aminopeptidase/D-esterase-like protein
MNHDSLCDVPGLKVGHFTDPRRPTGCSVVLCEAGATCGVDVRGAAPGTRETDLLKPDNLVEQVHAVLLAGGSAFGLDAAGGVMRWLEEHGVGFPVGPARVPIVPAAVLFDLWLGDARIRPDAEAGYAACVAAYPVTASAAPAQGNVGAGAGATVGKLFGIERGM